MTEDAHNEHLAHRRAKADAFIDNPSLYKVCDCCRSICLRRARVCPLCAAYRFHEDAETIVATAAIIGATAFPQTSGTVPRIS